MTPQLQEISVHGLAEKLRSAAPFILLDVREPHELSLASIADSRLVVAPMSVLAQKGLQGLPTEAQARDAEVLVLCHHGNRSSQVTAWLAALGWTQVFNVAGGIDEYARRIDRSVGLY
jgi:rhodanese-related sulfurtransferase